jgi:hypothetical protein
LKNISKGSKTSEEKINKLLKYFLFCLQPAVRNKIQIYSLDSDHDLDDTIFKAIIQSIFVDRILIFQYFFFVAKQKQCSETKAGLNREQLLQLALAWDAIEVAKEYIIKDDLNDLSVISKII